MRVSILEGVYATEAAEFVSSYPINFRPVITDSGLSEGYLHLEPGITFLSYIPGIDRGAINWNGFCHRVCGSKLVRIEGSTVIELGDVGVGAVATDCSFDYSFDRLAVTSEGNLYYWDGTTLAQVTDPDLGVAIDVIWIDGYFMTTDGSYLVVTELSDPFSVNPLKYGSSDASPDLIVALKKVRNEAYAINRYTIENFQNVGGTGFPFTRNVGGLIPRGAVGGRAVDYFEDSIAFVGSGRNEATSVFIAGYGETTPISTPAIDAILAAEPDQTAIVVETVKDQDGSRFLIHLTDRTLVFHHQATLRNKAPVWTELRGGVAADTIYPIKHIVYAEGRWIGGGSEAVGYLDSTVETHFNFTVGWQFDTTFLYNEGRGGILKVAELVGLPGRAPVGVVPTMFMSWTQDGQTWSQERTISSGERGARLQRMQFRPKTKFSNYLGMRFRGSSTAMQGFARLEIQVEPLNA